MDSDFRDYLDMPDPGVKRARRRGYSRFGWTVALLLLAGVVMASWIGSIYIFNHPENADCYHFLKQWNRMEPIKRFELTAAPKGKFYTAQELHDMFLVMSNSDIEAKNEELLRNYLRNYSQAQQGPVPYLYGHFTTKGVYELSKSDVFPSGMVAVADSADCPQVTIEHIYPTAFPNVPRARQMLATDPDIHLDKSLSIVTIIHVTKLDEEHMLFTVVPIDYGPYAYRQGISSTFRLDPPANINIEAGFPVVKPSLMEGAMKTFALYRKNRSMLAGGEMLTLPPAGSASPKIADNRNAQDDLPPEATQPYHPPVIAELAPENDDAPVTPPSEMPPSSADKAAAQTLESQATVAPNSLPPVAPTSTVMTAAARPGVTRVAPAPTSTSPVVVSTAPVIAKTTLTASAPPAPAVSSRALAATAPAPAVPSIVKQDKTAQHLNAAASLPPPVASAAPIVRPVAHAVPSPIPAVVRPNPADVAALFRQSTHSSTPQPVVERQPPLPAHAPVQYADAIPPATSQAAAPASPSKLQPFLSQPAQAPAPLPRQQPSTIAPARSASWQTYSPGLMPRGKLISTEQAPQLADYGIGSDRLYINGHFIVTAASDGRAVLRPVNGNGSLSGVTVRVVVEYPAGARVPGEGSEVARGSLRPFQVTDVRRGSDGQVNIYAREVTVPESQASNTASPYNHYRMTQQSYNSVD